MKISNIKILIAPNFEFILGLIIGTLITYGIIYIL